MDTQRIFLDSNGTVRSGWRAAVFLAAYGLASTVAGALLYVAFALAGRDLAERTPLNVIAGSLAGLIPALVLGWGLGRLFESLPVEALGASPKGRWGLHFAVGIALGSALIGIAVIGAAASGGLAFAAGADEVQAIGRDLLVSFAVYAAAAAFEEALFRGYLFQTLARAGVAWLAIVLTSAFFGIVHLGNPSANGISTANTILAGVLFGAAYLRTRDLWFAFGLHLAWNWVQGSIFGIEVSGLRLVPATLLAETDRGPAWLTGADYGLEGSIACTGALIVGIAAIWLWPRRTSTEPGS